MRAAAVRFILQSVVCKHLYCDRGKRWGDTIVVVNYTHTAVPTHCSALLIERGWAACVISSLLVPDGTVGSRNYCARQPQQWL